MMMLPDTNCAQCGVPLLSAVHGDAEGASFTTQGSPDRPVRLTMTDARTFEVTCPACSHRSPAITLNRLLAAGVTLDQTPPAEIAVDRDNNQLVSGVEEPNVLECRFGFERAICEVHVKARRTSQGETIFAAYAFEVDDAGKRPVLDANGSALDVLDQNADAAAESAARALEQLFGQRLSGPGA